MTALSLASVLAEPARRRPDVTAVVEDTASQGGARLTYGELWRDARAVAAALAARGTGPGDRVALLAPNVADFVRSYFGILAAGGVVVPVPTLLTEREAARSCATPAPGWCCITASSPRSAPRPRRRPASRRRRWRDWAKATIRSEHS